MTEQEKRHAAGYRVYHGIEFPPKRLPNGQAMPVPPWRAEGLLYLDESGEFCKSKSYLGKAQHFINFCNHIWGDPNDEGFFEWNPNAIKMLECSIAHKFVSIAGCASSGKTQFIALYAVSHFILRPLTTKILVTSMTIQTAEGKVWGNVKKMWGRACRRLEMKDANGNVIMEGERFLGGKLIGSMHIIKRRSPDGILHSTEGIELIPAEAGEFKKSAAKMQGYKAGNVYLLADELATLAPNILETARENLFSNDNFELKGAFNPDSHYDPGGILSEPVDGWDSVDEHMMEWPTRFGGWCVRFDGTLSPNVTGNWNGDKPWKGLMTFDKLEGFKQMHPEKSVGFWKMVRGYWSPTGSMDCIYSESEFESNGCLRPIKAWAGPWKMVAGFDPAWTTGGDRAVGVFGRVGLAILPESGGQTRIVWEHVETCIFDEEIDKKNTDKPTQIAKQFAAKCRQHGVATEDVALDVTGGHAFATVLALEIGKGFMALNFGGSASDLPMPKPDKRTCKEAYRDLMSELWLSSKSLVRQGQLRNMTAGTIVELCARTYDENNGKLRVEPKEKMKSRIKRSPDRADATMLSVYVARKKHSLLGKESFPKRSSTTQLTENPHLTGGNPDHPMAHLTDWGRKRARVLEEHPVESGGGWGDSW